MSRTRSSSPRPSVSPAVAVAAALLVLAALAVAVGFVGAALAQSALSAVAAPPLSAPDSSDAPTSSDPAEPAPGGASGTSDGHASGAGAAAAPPDAPAALGAPGHLERQPVGEADRLTEADGLLPGGVTVFDAAYPAVAGLDPALLQALQDAATAGGLDLYVTSGWRSEAYQSQLFADAVAAYGSEAEAARWVAPADRSLHVTGDAVDLGDEDALAWLADHGSAFGLCQIYDNEPWHYEWRPSAPAEGCPSRYPDSSWDPRLR